MADQIVAWIVYRLITILYCGISASCFHSYIKKEKNSWKLFMGILCLFNALATVLEYVFYEMGWVEI